MNNQKRDVHNTGVLGMLLKTGQIKRVGEATNPAKTPSSQFKTEAGIEFSESELCTVDPNECTPWAYANRLEDEMGDMDALIQSLKESGQLQPGLVRPLTKSDYKYEIIFGRRRHAACLKLGIPFLVIIKNISSTEDAITLQDAENKLRNDVSNYSNAFLYKKLLDDGIFKSGRQLAEKLKLSSASFTELMSFTRIPQDIVKLIPDIHNLSIRMALKIIALNSDDQNHQTLLKIAPKIGLSITSTAKLEHEVLKGHPKHLPNIKSSPKVYKNNNGKELFTIRTSPKGNYCLTFSQETSALLDYEVLCKKLQEHIEQETEK